MKVRIEYTVEVSDEERLALAMVNGEEGRKADRNMIHDHFEQFGTRAGRKDLAMWVKGYYESKSREYAEKAKALKDEG
jgi:hypothetical protein